MGNETHLINDMNVEEKIAGGFVFVRLRDSDDGDTFQLGEDEILTLHDYLAATIKKHRLRKDPTLALFIALTEGYPAPWSLQYHDQQEHHSRQFVSAVVAADGETPITLETHSGDGDAFYLGSEGAEALVAFVNRTAIIYQTKNQQTHVP